MKNVVLIGDSIRLGYQEQVKKLLAKKAEFFTPAENGGHSANLLVYLHLWVLNRQPDIVHMNCGLHDLKTVYYGGRESVVSLPFYAENVEKLLRITKERSPRTQLIWATTTPVIFSRAHANHAQYKDFDRYEVDVDSYNDVARAICRKLDVPVNDLCAFVRQQGVETMVGDDGVHYTPAGYERLGQAVANALEPYL